LFKIADIFTGRYNLIRYFSKLHLFILKNFKNKYLNELIGIPILVLITIGRKSNKKRYAPLVYFKIDDCLLIVASNGGNPKDPNWYQNLISQKTVHININGKIYECNYSIIENELRDYYWTEILKIYPKYNEYQNLSGRIIPVVNLKKIVV
jgi:F420H(2)-dependent quinone reductase|tara:strand:+ start:222 stop:674 length:453 start_codon:yes stop_codon:yes gene_type:complete